MSDSTAPRLDHLKRLTDSHGIIHDAQLDFPDRFGGYAAVENTDALRLCALASDTVDADTLSTLAGVYFTFLTQARRRDAGVYHHCDPMGQWHNNGDDLLVQSRLACALSSVIVSELPIKMRLTAAEWWRDLLGHADNVRFPVAAANWLIALGTLRAADPGKDLDRTEALARWLVEDCYYPVRSGDWEWFESRWAPGAANIPAALWQAYFMLGERRYAGVAEVTTQFVIDHLFEDDMLMPVGTHGGWSRNTSKAAFDQLPAEVCAVAELLQLAERVSEEPEYRRYAQAAAGWFAGNNIHDAEMIDEKDCGCYDSLTITGPNKNQGASAIVSYLLTQAAITINTPITQESTHAVTHVG